MSVLLTRCSGFSGGDQVWNQQPAQKRDTIKLLQAVKMSLEQRNVSLKSTDGGIAAGAAPPDYIFGQFLHSSGSGRDTKPSQGMAQCTAINSSSALHPSVCT